MKVGAIFIGGVRRLIIPRNPKRRSGLVKSGARITDAAEAGTSSAVTGSSESGILAGSADEACVCDAVSSPPTASGVAVCSSAVGTAGTVRLAESHGSIYLRHTAIANVSTAAAAEVAESIGANHVSEATAALITKTGGAVSDARMGEAASAITSVPVSGAAGSGVYAGSDARADRSEAVASAAASVIGVGQTALPNDPVVVKAVRYNVKASTPKSAIPVGDTEFPLTYTYYQRLPSGYKTYGCTDLLVRRIEPPEYGIACLIGGKIAPEQRTVLQLCGPDGDNITLHEDDYLIVTSATDLYGDAAAVFGAILEEATS